MKQQTIDATASSEPDYSNFTEQDLRQIILDAVADNRICSEAITLKINRIDGVCLSDRMHRNDLTIMHAARAVLALHDVSLGEN